MSSGEAGQNNLENQLNAFRNIQKEIGRVQGSISSAGTQILENEMVLKVLPCLVAVQRSLDITIQLDFALLPRRSSRY